MKKFAVLVGVLVLSFWLSTSVVFVDETEFGYRTRFGETVGEAVGPNGKSQLGLVKPGLLLKMPWPIDTVRRFDRRLQIYEPPSLERMTRDKKPLTVGSYICWRISDVPKFFKTLRTIATANRRLEEQLSDKLSAAIGRTDLNDLVSDEPGASEIEPMMSDLTELLHETAEREFGIEVTDIRLRRFNHPAAVRPSIYERIRSERNMDAVRYRSEGESDAQKIRSRAELARDVILAKAEEEATKIQGRAEAEKTRILNQAHAKDAEFYDLLRTLEAYRKILDEKTTLLLSTDNAIFRLLTQKSPMPESSTAEPSGSPADAGN